MNRRTYLMSITAGGGLLAGCAGHAFPDGDDRRSCPAYPDDHGEGQTMCQGNKQTSSVYLTAEADTVAGSGGTLTFTFVNESDTDISYGPDLWTLYKWISEDWHILIPLEGFAGAKVLPATELQEFQLEVGARSSCDSGVVLQYATCDLDPGHYLFGIQGNTPDGTNTLFLASFRVTQ